MLFLSVVFAILLLLVLCVFLIEDLYHKGLLYQYEGKRGNATSSRPPLVITLVRNGKVHKNYSLIKEEGSREKLIARMLRKQ